MTTDTMTRLLRLLVLALVLGAGACGGNADGDTADGGADADSDTDGDADGDSDGDWDWAEEFAAVFAQDHVIQVSIVFDDPGAWADMLANKMLQEYHSATVTIDGESIEQVGVRFKGNSSLQMSEDDNTKSLKLHFEEYVGGQSFHGIDRLSLNNQTKDPSMMRERLAYALAGAYGLTAPRTASAEVTIDGDLHGVFTMVQQVDKRLLKERYGEPDADDGNLYKLYSDYDFGYLGADATPDDYGDSEAETGLVLKTNEDDPELNDFADVTAFVKALADVRADPSADNRAALEALFDIDVYLRYQAWTLAISNLDVYYLMEHNLYIYNNPETGRFETIPWDVNEAYGAFACQSGPPGPDNPPDPDAIYTVDLLTPCDAELPLNELTTKVPEYQARYCELLEELVDVTDVDGGGMYNADGQDGQIADLHALIGEARQRMDDEAVVTQPPGDYDYADYLSNQGYGAEGTGGGGGMGPEGQAIPNLGYFNDTRLGNLIDQIATLCD